VATETRVTRARRRAAVAVLVCAVTTGACYSTTPHRAEVASAADAQTCARAVGDVFAQSGFVDLPAPAPYSMLFGARWSGEYNSYLANDTAVGVVFAENASSPGSCRVILEAVSSDPSCESPSSPTLWRSPLWDPAGPSFPGVRTYCKLSYAPGEHNDAAVDELARRLRVALGAQASVERTSRLR
jgi:hypothetical protein